MKKDGPMVFAVAARLALSGFADKQSEVEVKCLDNIRLAIKQAELLERENRLLKEENEFLRSMVRVYMEK